MLSSSLLPEGIAAVKFNLIEHHVPCFDFNLLKTLQSGQAFRWYHTRDPSLIVVLVCNKLCIVSQQFPNILDIWIPEFEYQQEALSFWQNYFDIKVPPSKDFYKIMHSTDQLVKVYECSKGIHLLNQLPWETLLVFIISQRNNLHRIKQCVTKLFEVAGQPDEYGIHQTPTTLDILQADLSSCNLGYRDEYIRDAATTLQTGVISWENLLNPSTPTIVLVNSLQSIKGVGQKVAECTALFGFQRHELFPVDVWIERAIKEFNLTQDSIRSFGEYSGLVQQYIYYYMMNR